MKLEMKEIDGVPVTGIPDGSRTVSRLNRMSSFYLGYLAQKDTVCAVKKKLTLILCWQ